MDINILLSNLTNPTLLFFILGLIATLVKSDLEIPSNSVKFISLYLLFSIGFKGGQELVHTTIDTSILASLFFSIFISGIIPIYVFFALRKRVGISNSGAIAAAYGSVSAVTFVSAVNFLEIQSISFGGHMVAFMALMEAPAIIVGVILIKKFDNHSDEPQTSLREIVFHSLTNGSVLMILGSLVIGYISDSKQAEGIKPFTTDIFKGFLAIFLLEMGMVTARRIRACFSYGPIVFISALLFPLVNGIAVAYLSQFFISSIGDRFMFAILAASASYIAVPASMRLAAPKADPGLYIPMALGLTFPFNISIGMPLFLAVIKIWS